jgi:hypothetical protein
MINVHCVQHYQCILKVEALKTIIISNLARIITFVLILQIKTHFFQKIFHKVARIGLPKKSLVKLNIINTAHNSKNWTFREETKNQRILSPQFALNSIWIDRITAFYFGEISQIFNLKSMILTYIYTGFFMENLAQIHQISKENNAKSPDF